MGMAEKKWEERNLPKTKEEAQARAREKLEEAKEEACMFATVLSQLILGDRFQIPLGSYKPVWGHQFAPDTSGSC